MTALLVDPATAVPLAPAGDNLIAADGRTVATRNNGIVRFGRAIDVDLHIDDDVVDVHETLRTRTIRGRAIDGEVAWAAAEHSLRFPALHGEQLASLAPGAIVGDLGCGQLPYWPALPHDRIAAFYGFDGHLPSLQIAAREFGADPRLVLVESVAERTPIADGVFDAVISSEVIEHVEDPKAYLAEARRILKGGGLLSLSTPCGSMYVWPSELAKVLVGRVSPATMWHRLTPERRWREALAWHPALRPAVLRRWIEAAGFEVVRHDSTLWNTQTVLRPMKRLFALAERMVVPKAGAAYAGYLAAMDRLTRSGVPVVRFAGLRQFILARKRSGGGR